MRALFLATLFSLAAVSASAYADKVCVGYDSQGNCNGWVDTGGGGYTPNIPGAPQSPTTPNSGCICAGYTSRGTCSYWVNCSN